MGTEHRRVNRKYEDLDKLSVPPGFVSLTSFLLKKVEENEEFSNSMAFAAASAQVPVCIDTKSDIFYAGKLKRSLRNRPWILHEQGDHNQKESDSEQPVEELSLRISLPKGVTRGCPDCTNCLKVTATWCPEDARTDVLEEAPVFHPTEEMTPRSRKRSISMAIEDTPPSEDPSNSRPTRNESRGLATANKVQSSGRIPIVIDKDGKKQVGTHNTEFVNQLGVIARTCAPQCYKSWTKIPQEYKHKVLFPKVKDWFNIDLTLPNVLDYIDHHIGKAYSNYRTKKLKPVWIKHGPVAAHMYRPKNVSESDWYYLCRLWSSDSQQHISRVNAANRQKLQFNHRGGSKPFYAHRASNSSQDSTNAQQSMSELFKATHYNKDKGWINANAESSYQRLLDAENETQAKGAHSLTDEELSRRVFGDKTAYNVGLGTRKQSRSQQSNASSSQQVAQLQAELQETRERLATTEKRLNVFTERLGHFESFMNNVNHFSSFPFTESDE